MEQISPSCFYGKRFARLVEVEDRVEASHQSEVDIVIVPPPPDVQTDEEEFDDDELSTANMPRDVPGSLEIQESESEDEESNLPLSELAKKFKKNKRKMETPIRWTHRELNIDMLSTAGTSERFESVVNELSGLNAVQVFEKLFDKQVVEHIRIQTRLYANAANNHNFQITAEEIKIFVGCLLLSGYHVLVMDLLKVVEQPTDHAVFFDNYFSSHDLLRMLRERGFRATGTIRDNRTKKCPLPPIADIKKKDRGYYDYLFDSKNNLLLVRWNDNSAVTMITNYDSIQPTVKRWSVKKKAKISVEQPKVFQSYNRSMGGVDLLDQAVNNYRIAIRGKKW